jgi:hypothetical protein
MSKFLWYRVCAAVVLAFLSPALVWGQASLTNTGYAENFNSMGQDGTDPPDGWTVYTISGNSASWLAATGIPADQVAGIQPAQTQSSGLTPMLDPTTRQNNGFNAATSDAPDDRALSTSPTGVSGAVLELVLANNTGRDLTTLAVQYDIRRFTSAVGGQEELPGYWLFYSLDDGVTYTNVSQLNTDIKSVPDAPGVTHVPSTRFNLTSPLKNGSNIILRWVDDNGDAPSPDQILGLDNVSITAPSPPVSLTSSGFTESFDSMKQDGTNPPPGWNVYTIPGGNDQWQTSIPADSVSGGTPSAGLTAVLDPMIRQNNGLNAATSDAPDDRSLTTSPTGVAGAVLELGLTNNTGRDLTSLAIAYDIRRFTVGTGTEDHGNGPGADELPGFWLFYSLDNGFTYTNVSALNPDINSVPNTVGISHMMAQFDLSAPLTDGSLILLRWVDDNGIASSPDQIIGLDNLSITAP